MNRYLSKIKKLLFIIFALFLICGKNAPTNVNAATITVNEVNKKLDSIVAQYLGETEWPSSFGSQCYSFAHFVFNTVFGRNTIVGRYYEGTEYIFSNLASDIITVGSLAPGYTNTQLKQLLDKTMPGDYIQLKRAAGGPHSEIVLSVDPNANNITILDANSGSVPNQVRKYTQNYFTNGNVKSFRNWNQAVTVYRYKDYIVEQSPVGHIDTFDAGNGCINLGGWAYDPDDTSRPVEIKIEVGNSVYSVKADQTLEGYNEEKNGHAIATSIDVAERGEQNVKVWVIDLNGNDNTLLDSKTLTINSDTAPIGAVDSIGGDEGVIGLSGWAHDSDTPGAQMTLRLEIVGGSSYTFTTGDIGTSGYPSYSVRVPVKETGTLQVKVYALDQGPFRSDQKNVLLKNVTITVTQKHLNSYIDTYTEKIAQTVGAVTGLEGTLKIEGWVQDIHGIEKVEYEVLDVAQSSDGIKGICEHRERNDVASTNPGYPTGNEGYYAYIPYRDLRYAHYYPDNMKIILTAYCKGGQQHSLGTIEVKRSFPENTGPTISDIQISDVSYQGYTIKATVSDESGVDRVQFPSWTLKNGQDDIIEDWGSNEKASGKIVGNTVTYRVNTADHNNETGTYKTHIYAYDKYGNYTAFPINGTRGELEIPVRESYTISYDANGGTGAPEAQTKLEGQNITLSSTKPSRLGYTFVGWKGKDKEYQPGALYSLDQNEVLYAIWNEQEHNYIKTITKAATCTEKGTETFECSICGKTYTEDIAETGHSWDEGKITAEATCTDDGVKTYSCYICGETKTERIPHSGHIGTIETRNAVPVTCTKDGYTGDKYCSACNQIVETGKVVPKTDHMWNAGIITTEPTCSSDGIRTYTCSICHDTKTETVTSTGHLGPNVVKFAKTATCMEDGYTGDEYCQACGKITKEGKRISATGHSWNSGVITKEPTCTEDGTKMYTCDHCQETKTESIAASGHTGPNVVKFAKTASCTSDGYSGDEYCEACGKMVKEGKVIRARGHSWDSGRITTQPTVSKKGVKTYTCRNCKAARTEAINALGLKVGTTIKDTKSNGYYKVTDKKGLVAFVKPINAKKSSASIPDTIKYQGITCKVTAIANNAFKGNKYLVKLKIGNYVTSIGVNSFYGCVKLSSVTLGNNTIVIGNNAFAKCISISKLTIPAKVVTIGKQAFYGCKKLVSITIKTNKLTSKTAGTYCFKGIHAKPTIGVPKTMYSYYRKLLYSRGVSSKAIFKKF